MPASLVRQARWITLEPSCMSSINLFSLWDEMLKLLNEAMLNESPAQQLIILQDFRIFQHKKHQKLFWSWRLGQEDIPDNAIPLMALTSMPDLTMCWYTAFLSLTQTLSNNSWERFSSVRRTNTFSVYCNMKKLLSSI